MDYPPRADEVEYRGALDCGRSGMDLQPLAKKRGFPQVSRIVDQMPVSRQVLEQAVAHHDGQPSQDRRRG
jgi:hypothetical protein